MRLGINVNKWLGAFNSTQVQRTKRGKKSKSALPQVCQYRNLSNDTAKIAQVVKYHMQSMSER